MARARTVASNGRNVASPRSASNPKRVNRDWSVGQYNETLLNQLYSFGYGPKGHLKTVGFTSAKRLEGVTTVSCNLGLYAADCHRLRVLIVDANHVTPSLQSIFQLKPGPGLSDLQHDPDTSWNECIHDFSGKPLETWPSTLRQSLRRSRGRLRRTRGRDDSLAPQLSILPAGSGELAANGFGEAHHNGLLVAVRDHFDLIIVDLPAVETSAGGGFPMSELDGLLYVLKAESTSDAVARKGLRHLRLNDGNVLGIVFNQRRTHLPNWIDKRLGD